MWVSPPLWSSCGAGEIALIAPRGGEAYILYVFKHLKIIDHRLYNSKLIATSDVPGSKGSLIAHLVVGILNIFKDRKLYVF